MGSIQSARLPDMDSDEERPRSNSSTRQHQNNPGNSELQNLVTYLIHSGQIRFASSEMDDLSDEDSDDDFVGPSPPAAIDASPDVSSINKNYIKQQVLADSGRWIRSKKSCSSLLTLTHLMQRREIGMDSRQHFTAADCCLVNSRFLPNQYQKLTSYHHKVFCGTYSKSGDIFLTACQDQHVRIYDTRDNKFKLLKSIRARDVGWSILDVAFSPDSNYMIYSSWSDCIHLCNISGDHDVHESLLMSPGEHSFCIFSLMFSSDSREIVGGANDGCLYIYDRESNQRTQKIDAHDDDVNTVTFADDTSQILFSGGDDGLCKIWDRRTLKESDPAPVGVMAGHLDGVTYIDSKGDSRYFISNSKDQTIKLWDVRVFSPKEGVEATKKAVSGQRWDYRWQQVPRNFIKKRKLNGDTSVMTYRGHCVLHTLVRCRFSPAFITGQRYIYSGCASGSAVVYDLLTGRVVKKLEGGHRTCVRDVSWHPYQNTLMSSSWDGTVGRWDYKDYWAQEPEDQKLHYGDGDMKYATRWQTSRRCNNQIETEKVEKKLCTDRLFD